MNLRSKLYILLYALAFYTNPRHGQFLTLELYAQLTRKQNIERVSQ